MSVLLITVKASRDQMIDMLSGLGSYVKLAVDVEKGILAGGGTLHADCEAILLENGSEQRNVWGADWFPHSQEVTYESLINIRPSQGNLALEIQDENLRFQVKEIAIWLLGGVPYE